MRTVVLKVLNNLYIWWACEQVSNCQDKWSPHLPPCAHHHLYTCTAPLIIFLTPQQGAWHVIKSPTKWINKNCRWSGRPILRSTGVLLLSPGIWRVWLVPCSSTCPGGKGQGRGEGADMLWPFLLASRSVPLGEYSLSICPTSGPAPDTDSPRWVIGPAWGKVL